MESTTDYTVVIFAIIALCILFVYLVLVHNLGLFANILITITVSALTWVSFMFLFDQLWNTDMALVLSIPAAAAFVVGSKLLIWKLDK